jgi:uncharacterized membrane protein
MKRALQTPHGKGMAAVIVGAVVYATIWCAYLFLKQDAFKTGAEDLGIMDQVAWATSHGHFMLETICNTITDVNCLAGNMRFAIHFEPILIPVSLLYLVLPTPKLLLFLQTVTIASSVIPTYLLAERKLRHPAWGLGFAVLFLLCPAVQSAVVDDFHPEVFAAPLLLWALYFIETRRDRRLIAVCAMALLCKETIALVVLCLGVYLILARGRRRLGALLAGMGGGTLALALLIMHFTSLIGRSPVTSRFAPLMHDPVHALALMVADPSRWSYLVGLFAQTGFLALLSPWMVLVALPSIAVNVLSANVMMYSGGAQYNVHLAPFLIAGAIDGVAWLKGVLPQWAPRLGQRIRRLVLPQVVILLRMLVARRRPAYTVMATLVILTLWGLGLQQSLAHDYSDYLGGGSWPVQTQHTRIGHDLLMLIPADATVSAEAGLVPHLSERVGIYQYPSGEDTADYIFLDVTTGSFYPFRDTSDYVTSFQGLLVSGDFDMLDADDGYLLLRRWPANVHAQLGHPLTLPQSFFSFVTTMPSSASQATLATFLQDAQLFGLDAGVTIPSNSSNSPSSSCQTQAPCTP